MNQFMTMPELAADVYDEHEFEPLFARLLAPLDPALPCGPPARYDAAVTEIRLLREEDDPSLPMGQWERPLKRADWAGIEQHCVMLLCERSKDLQTVVWLAEAWMRQDGFVGLGRGLRVLDALLRTYWPGLYPLIDDDGDCDARLAPLEWLNETLGTAIQLHAPLLTVDECRPPQVTLAYWERLAEDELAGAGKTPADAAHARSQGLRLAQRDSETPPTRAELLAAAGRMISRVAVTRGAVRDSMGYVDSIVGFLRDRLQEQAPQMARLRNVLEAADRVLSQVHASQQAGLPSAMPAIARAAAAGAADGAPGKAGDAGEAAEASRVAEQSGIDEASPTAPLAPAVTVLAGGWRDRKEAYATLEALADYLVGLEPHSPTPFLLRRAVRWGNMPLPEVLAEIMREEGDLNRLINVLGLQS